MHFIRGTPALRALFSRHVPPPLPKRQRVPNKRKSRAKPKPFDLSNPRTWGFDANVSLADLLKSPGEE
jgi:hypothetical protein